MFRSDAYMDEGRRITLPEAVWGLGWSQATPLEVQMMAGAVLVSAKVPVCCACGAPYGALLPLGSRRYLCTQCLEQAKEMDRLRMRTED